MQRQVNDVPSEQTASDFGWNEIQFLDADELRRMAPSIVGLEIRRLGQSCRHVPLGSDLYNAMVAARFELKRFLNTLDETDGASINAECGIHLEAALIYLGLYRTDADGEVLGVIEYATDRMSHILERMRLLY